MIYLWLLGSFILAICKLDHCVGPTSQLADAVVSIIHVRNRDGKWVMVVTLYQINVYSRVLTIPTGEMRGKIVSISPSLVFHVMIVYIKVH